VSESEIQARCLLASGREPGVRLFRNTVGEGWYGKVIARTATTLTLLHPRHVTFGLMPGSGDLIGWQRDGLFLSAEIKIPGEHMDKGQRNWRDRVIAGGGVAFEAHSPEELISNLRGFARPARN
jgi:hypothetical protein